MSDLIMAATRWPSNAEMIADVAKLGYIGNYVLDATYGRGTWWKEFVPGHLRAMSRTFDPTWDFTDMSRYPDCTFDTVAYDPPYIAPGGRKTSTTTDFNDRYGIADCPKNPRELQKLINAGLSECERVLKHKGTLLVKCCDYVSSGKLWLGSHFTIDYARQVLDLELVDRLYHVGDPGPQSQKRQVHARQNLSTLLILRKP